MDAINGYFQLALDEDSLKLTTFILPSGRYRYLGAPMGLSLGRTNTTEETAFLTEPGSRF